MIITVQLLQKYKKYTVNQLISRATTVFNRFIRNRDRDESCISCGNFTTLQAGHYYSAGRFPALRFNENNVHGQCLKCNYYESGNLINYRKNLIHKIGIEEVEKLDRVAEQSKQNQFKWDALYLIEIIEKYK